MDTIKYESGAASSIVDLRPKTVYQELMAEVVFGTPSKHCAGAGICMVSISRNKLRFIPCPIAPVWISSQGACSLQFRFEKSALYDATTKKRLSTQEFVVEEAFRLPLQLVRQLGLRSCWALPGIYPIIKHANDWTIQFNLL